MNKADRDAWGGFWTARGDAGQGHRPPDALLGIDQAQRETWQRFARGLRKGARLLDLATGDGAVLAKIAATRPDLKLIGIDASPRLPPAPKGTVLKSGVSMERLPFPQARFDAVTSQFGFEYGETRLSAQEAGRVLKPGGALLFIVHHSDGPILAHNLPRLEPLRWVLSPGGYLEKAQQFLRVRRVASVPTPPFFAQGPHEAQRLFPSQSVAAELISAIFQTLELGRNAPAQEAIAVLKALEGKARNEVARIESLARAVCDTARIADILQQLGDAGLKTDPPVTLCEPGFAQPFAWLISGFKAQA